MFRRSAPPVRPVRVTLDGRDLAAGAGEPLAVALLAAGIGTLSRSPKLHRPRGPACLRGGCDGCLMRVDGRPNVMTCLHPIAGGEVVETQNVLGTRETDLLRGADWFFRNGIDHHHLFAGTPGLSTILQSFARKISGLGRLPAAVAPPEDAERVEADVVVVGGGPAGLVAASALGASGFSCLLVEDATALGGALRGAPEELARLRAKHPLGDARVRLGTTAFGWYEGEVVAAGPREGESGPERALRVRPRATVLASGAHDGTWVGPGNDLPGVLSARALARLLAGGLEPTVPVALVGSGPWADRLAAALRPVARVAAEDLVSIEGRSRVKGIVVRSGRKQRSIAAGVVALALPPAPAFELAGHAGVEPRWDGAGYAPARDDGRVAPGVWAAGECAGTGEELDAIERDAGSVAASVARALGGQPSTRVSKSASPPAAKTRSKTPMIKR